MFIKKGQNSNVWKDMVRIPMFVKIGLEVTNVWEDEIQIPMCNKIGPELQCFQGWGQNANV